MSVTHVFIILANGIQVIFIPHIASFRFTFGCSIFLHLPDLTCWFPMLSSQCVLSVLVLASFHQIVIYSFHTNYSLFSIPGRWNDRTRHPVHYGSIVRFALLFSLTILPSILHKHQNVAFSPTKTRFLSRPSSFTRSAPSRCTAAHKQTVILHLPRFDVM